MIQKKHQEVKEEIVRRGVNRFVTLPIDNQDDTESESGDYESKEDQKYERIVRNEDTQTYDINKMTRAELEKVVKEQQQRDALKEDDMGGKNSNSSEAIALVDEGESEGGSPLVDNTEISESMEMVNINVAVRDDAVLRRERMEDNTEKMDMHRLILMTAKEFKDEIEEVRRS